MRWCGLSLKKIFRNLEPMSTANAIASSQAGQALARPLFAIQQIVTSTTKLIAKCYTPAYNGLTT